jgi:hypothetical protein
LYTSKNIEEDIQFKKKNTAIQAPVLEVQKNTMKKMKKEEDDSFESLIKEYHGTFQPGGNVTL